MERPMHSFLDLRRGETCPLCSRKTSSLSKQRHTSLQGWSGISRGNESDNWPKILEVSCDYTCRFSFWLILLKCLFYPITSLACVLFRYSRREERASLLFSFSSSCYWKSSSRSLSTIINQCRFNHVLALNTERERFFLPRSSRPAESLSFIFVHSKSKKPHPASI